MGDHLAHHWGTDHTVKDTDLVKRAPWTNGEAEAHGGRVLPKVTELFREQTGLITTAP